MKALLALVLAQTSLSAGATPPSRVRPCSHQDSLGVLRPGDSTFGDAEVLRKLLTEHGFVVHCVIRSTFASFGASALGTRREAAFLTSRGDFEMLFFPPPAGAERVQVKEERAGSGWRYSFPPRSGPGDTIYAARRQYFVRSRRWFIVVQDSSLATELRGVLPRRATQRRGASPGG